MTTKEMFKIHYIANGKVAAMTEYKVLFNKTCVESIEFIQKLEEEYPEIIKLREIAESSIFNKPLLNSEKESPCL